jgi:hypothetical protein
MTNSPEEGRSNKKKAKADENSSGQKLTTPYPHKYKTVMCKSFAAGNECKFGD